jgi:PTS system nitrogen regulatory IIA component
MNRVGAVLSPGRVRVDVSAVSKQQILEEAGRLFASYEGWEPSHIAARLAAREALGSTGVGYGFAIPHARLKGLRQAVAAFLRLDPAIPFDAPDGKPVSEMLVVLVPEEAKDEHLQMLAEAAEMFNDRDFRARLHEQGDAAGVYRTIADWTSKSAC